MLSSISPLGERARAARWPVTVGAYLGGSVLGGAAVGLVAASVGSLLPEPWRASRPVVVAAAVLLLVGLLLDLRVGGSRLPTIHRQVDEDWMARYRGWVYGVGYGVQLGAGVVTIVTSATVYAVWLLALLAGRPLAGVLLGAAFGLVRALPVLTLRRVYDPAALRRTFHRVERWRRPAERVALGSLVVGAGARLLAGW